ncbi:MAG: sugar phosphate isomerase/epimerase [Fimbriimonadaceae bacterium]|nr:sugar phosphate isomerase/epimerase [Fimbriimonadaceae bacterium]
MKLGVSMYSYVAAVKAGQMDIRSFIHEAARIGAEGVELLDFFYTDWDSERKIARAALQEVGLPCAVFSVANNFAKETAEAREHALNIIKRGVDEAEFYETNTVRVFAGDVYSDSTFTQEQAFEWIIEGLAQASDYAHTKGIRLALENHGKLAGLGSQINDIIGKVRAKTGHDALGANPDTGNFLLVDQPGHEGVAEVAANAYMVHFKDFAPDPEGHYEGKGGKRFAGTVIGEGTVDLASALASLKAAGFEGWVNLEYEGEADPMVGVPNSLDNSFRFLNAVR